MVRRCNATAAQTQNVGSGWTLSIDKANGSFEKCVYEGGDNVTSCTSVHGTLCLTTAPDIPLNHRAFLSYIGTLLEILYRLREVRKHGNELVNFTTNVHTWRPLPDLALLPVWVVARSYLTLERFLKPSVV